MDSVLFLQMNDKEFVFKKGIYYADHAKDGFKDFDHTYALVAPASLGPMTLFLTAKK